MELKQYRVKAKHIPDFDCVITAHTKVSAWNKFCTQRFGVLKPNPHDYSVTFHQHIEV